AREGDVAAPGVLAGQVDKGALTQGAGLDRAVAETGAGQRERLAAADADRAGSNGLELEAGAAAYADAGRRHAQRTSALHIENAGCHRGGAGVAVAAQEDEGAGPGLGQDARAADAA